MTFLIILTLLLTICLIIVAGVRIEPHIISRFELGRRATGRDSAAKRILEREERLSELVTLLRIKQSLLLVLVVFCAIGAFGWLWGALYALLVSLTFGAVARTSLAQKLSSALWERSEPHVLRWLDRLRPVSRTLRVDAVIDAEMYRRFDSREELGKLIQQSKDILSANDRLLLSHGLQFAQKHVDEVMTPRAAIDSINNNPKTAVLDTIKINTGKTGTGNNMFLDSILFRPYHTIFIFTIQDRVIIHKCKQFFTFI